MQSHLEEAFGLLTVAAMRRRARDYRERAQQLREMAVTETEPTLQADLEMLANRYAELAGDD